MARWSILLLAGLVLTAPSVAADGHEAQDSEDEDEIRYDVCMRSEQKRNGELPFYPTFDGPTGDAGFFIGLKEGEDSGWDGSEHYVSTHCAMPLLEELIGYALCPDPDGICVISET